MACFVCLTTGALFAQDLKSADVPAVVKTACMKKFPQAAKVSWEKEDGNFEANWGGKSGEDNSAMFTLSGTFVEIVKAIAAVKNCTAPCSKCNRKFKRHTSLRFF